MSPLDPGAPTDPSVGVRPALEALRKRRRRHGLLVAGGGIVAIVGFGVGAALALTGNGDGRAITTHDPAASTTTTRPTRVHRQCRAPLTGTDPLRLWIAGDSLAGALGVSLGQQTAETGVVQPIFDSRVSSGLSTPSFFDWPAHATQEIARLDPEVVVFIIGANDWLAVRNDGVEWEAEYEAQVEAMLAVFETDGRRVYWVGSPPMKEDRKDKGVRAVNEIMQTVIGRHPKTTYVDAYKLFADSEGKYIPSVVLPGGDKVRVRASDGVHFTPEGGVFLAGNVFEPIDARCRLAAQAVPGAPKEVIESEGSSRVPGTRRATSGTTATTPPPATAAPGTVVENTTTTTTTVATTTSSSTPSTPDPTCGIPSLPVCV